MIACHVCIRGGCFLSYSRTDSASISLGVETNYPLSPPKKKRARNCKVLASALICCVFEQHGVCARRTLAVQQIRLPDFPTSLPIFCDETGYSLMLMAGLSYNPSRRDISTNNPSPPTHNNQTGGNLDTCLLIVAGVPLQPVLRDVSGPARQKGRRREDLRLYRRFPQRQDRPGEADNKRGLHGAPVAGGNVRLAPQVTP